MTEQEQCFGVEYHSPGSNELVTCER